MQESLPVIDMRPALGGDLGALRAFAAEIGKAARDVGFFYLAGHGVDDGLISSVFLESARLAAT